MKVILWQNKELFQKTNDSSNLNLNRVIIAKYTYRAQMHLLNLNKNTTRFMMLHYRRYILHVKQMNLRGYNN